MDVIPFLFLCLSAVLMFLSWFNDGPSRRVVSVTFALFLFIIGVILVFLFNDDSFLQDKRDILTNKTRVNNQLLWSLGCGILGYALGWITSRRKYINHGN